MLVARESISNSEKHQFLNTVLIDNPVVGRFSPYTAFTTAAVWLPTPEHVFLAGVTDNTGR